MSSPDRGTPFNVKELIQMENNNSGMVGGDNHCIHQEGRAPNFIPNG